MQKATHAGSAGTPGSERFAPLRAPGASQSSAAGQASPAEAGQPPGEQPPAREEPTPEMDPVSAASHQASFLHSVAHELSTPLTPLIGYLKILLSGKLGPLSERQGQVLRSMSHSAEHLALIIDNLVDLADFEAGRTELRLAPVCVGGLVTAALEDARVAGRTKRLTVEGIDCADQLLRGDEGKLRQALANLMDNAVRFSPHGGVILGEVRDAGAAFELSIYDQGAGMNAGEFDRLSRPFSHAAWAYPARRPGAGLGLPVARRIAEAHAGELRAESPPQTQPLAIHHFAGTRVTLVLPKSGPPLNCPPSSTAALDQGRPAGLDAGGATRVRS